MPVNVKKKDLLIYAIENNNLVSQRTLTLGLELYLVFKKDFESCEISKLPTVKTSEDFLELIDENSRNKVRSEMGKYEHDDFELTEKSVNELKKLDSGTINALYEVFTRNVIKAQEKISIDNIEEITDEAKEDSSPTKKRRP